MDYLTQSFNTALTLIINCDREVFATVWTSLSVSILAIVVSTFLGVPLGLLVALRNFCGKRLVLTLLNTLMALPTVLVGLVVYGLLSRQGPLGEMGLLFTPTAMMIGQVVLAIPIVANYTLGAAAGADARILPTALTLGASPLEGLMQLLLEIRFGIVAAIAAGFGRIVAEVGVAMMLGGNIRGYTRTMTTAIALETSKGEFAFALALGIILMSVALLVNLFLNSLQQR